ncbi:MAG: glycosyltransferase family 2 protein [Candidatus Thorarchaeota archaeon]
MTSILSNQSEISSFCFNVINKHNFVKQFVHVNNTNDENQLKEIHYKFKLIITIPAYNEEDTIGGVISNIRNVIEDTKYSRDYIILVVNDGSTDRTAEAAISAGAFVYSHETNLGLAETFRTEMKLCSTLGAEIIVHTDADGQYSAEQIPLLINEIENGFDLVLGSRFKGTIEKMSLLKKLGNIAFSVVLTILTRRKISDGQTGFRAFTNNVAMELEIISDHTYTQEQIIRATQKQLNIKEIPVNFTTRNNGNSRLMKSPLDYAFKAWKNIFKIYFAKK